MTLTEIQQRALALKLRRAKKVETKLVSIEYHSTGTAARAGIGTVYKATVRLVEGSLSWLIFLPSPKNSRQLALATLCQFLNGEPLKIENAKIKTS
jgi:hypothetical protein